MRPVKLGRLKLGGTASSRANVAYPKRVLQVVMVSVELGKLSCRGLEGYFGADIPAGVRKALLHYVYKLKAGRRPIAAPRFLKTSPAPQSKFDLTLDRETEAVLEQEALRQRTTVSRLAAHAVLVYLAELEFLGVAPRKSSD
jgi:transglutaminase-like putative cysteine protease